MSAPRRHTSRPVRRWATLLGLSAAVHAVVLAGFAFRVPPPSRIVALTAIDVSLAPSIPFAQPLPAAVPPDRRPLRDRAVRLVSTAPRYAGSADAETGEATDAVDLFGPVFADGLWPRPMVVRRDACDGDEATQAGEACGRELVLIGLATDTAAGAKAQP